MEWKIRLEARTGWGEATTYEVGALRRDLGDLTSSETSSLRSRRGGIMHINGGFKSEAQRLVSELKLKACENWPRSERTPPEGSETRA